MTPEELAELLKEWKTPTQEDQSCGSPVLQKLREQAARKYSEDDELGPPPPSHEDLINAENLFV